MKLSLILLVLVLSGCQSNGVIFKHQPLSSTSITTMDARQRSVVSNKINDVKGDTVFLRLCAEPYPDIFTIVSASLSAGLNAETSMDAGKLAGAKVGGEIAQALKESGASIERSQTVNLLNMSLYRTCERYLNGAITGDELKIQAMRDQKTMVSVLAIEQLTNIARPTRQPVILLGSPVESSTQSISARELSDANKKLNDLLNEKKVKEAAKNEALKDSTKEGECVFTEVDKANTCNSALKEFKNIELSVNNQQKYFDSLSQLIKSPTYAKVTEGQSSGHESGEIKVYNLDSEAIKIISDTVYKLAYLGVALDPFESCMINALNYFNQDNSEGKYTAYSSSKKECFSLLSTSVVETQNETKLISGSPEKKDLKQTQSFNFYIQSLKDCSQCNDKAIDANKTINASKADTSSNLKDVIIYPIEYLDAKYMPSNNQIRYFDAISKAKAESISKLLKIEAKQFNVKNASKNLIELWIVE